MEADELHLAAQAERDEWGSDDTRRGYPKSSAVHLALATLLDTLGYRAEDIYETTPEFELRDRMARLSVAGYSEALVVARAILVGNPNPGEQPGQDRPQFPQRHPAMATARNIVNQILDEAGTDVATRQRINDDCDQFVAWMVERYATGSAT